jgi:hypothetical protein
MKKKLATFPYCGNHTRNKREIYSKIKCQNYEICCSQNNDNAQSVLGYKDVKKRIITNIPDETVGYTFRAVSEYPNLQISK